MHKKYKSSESSSGDGYSVRPDGLIIIKHNHGLTYIIYICTRVTITSPTGGPLAPLGWAIIKLKTSCSLYIHVTMQRHVI